MTILGRVRMPETIDTEADRIRIHVLHALSMVDTALSASRRDRVHFTDALLDIRSALVRADGVKP